MPRLHLARIPLENKLKSVLKKALRALKVGGRAEFFLLKDAQMRLLKRRFTRNSREKREVDVLAFPEPLNFPHPEERKRRILGEIYLNRDLGDADGPARLEFLLIHGLLHLLGYTHEGKGDTLKMEKLERKLMRQISSR